MIAVFQDLTSFESRSEMRRPIYCDSNYAAENCPCSLKLKPSDLVEV